MPAQITKRFFTVHDYYRMVDAKILSSKDRVELIRGEVLTMSPIGPPHSGAVLRASNVLMTIAGKRAIVSTQGPVQLSEYDEPQPDISLLRPRENFYTTRHPGPADIFLIIEMADSSLEYDRTIKAVLYAESGVPEYWVADIQNDCVWMYSNSDSKSYRQILEAHRGECHAPELLPDCPIPVDSLLP